MSADERPTLIAYDGSDDARHAIERAAELLPGRPVAVLHVWRPMAAPAGALLGISGADAEGGRARRNEEAAAESARLAAEGARLAAAAGLRTEALSAPDAGSPAEAIVAAAQERDAAVVVVGARGLSELRAALTDSVSAGVVRQARRPVLVISRRDDRSPHNGVSVQVGLPGRPRRRETSDPPGPSDQLLPLGAEPQATPPDPPRTVYGTEGQRFGSSRARFSPSPRLYPLALRAEDHRRLGRAVDGAEPVRQAAGELDGLAHAV